MSNAPRAPSQDLARLIVQRYLMSEQDNIGPLTHVPTYRRAEATLVEAKRSVERADGEGEMKNGALHSSPVSGMVDAIVGRNIRDVEGIHAFKAADVETILVGT
jgi:hypothetical protein